MGLFSSNRLASELPYLELFSDGTVLTKDDMLMKVWKLKFGNITFNQNEADDTSELMSSFFKTLTNSHKELPTAFYFVMDRNNTNISSTPEDAGLDNMVGGDREIEEERLKLFKDKKRNIQNNHYAVSCVRVSINENGITDESRLDAEDIFTRFESALRTTGAKLNALITGTTEENREYSILSFLYSMVHTEWKWRKESESGLRNYGGSLMGISEYLCDEKIKKGSPMLFGFNEEKAVQMLSINSYPSSTYALILLQMYLLPFPFRWVTRFIPRNNEESQKIARGMKNSLKNSSKSFLQAFGEVATGSEGNANINTQIASDIEEAEELQDSLTHGGVIGEFTSTLMITGEDNEELNYKIGKIEEVMLSEGFSVYPEDSVSNFITWKGSLPGNIHSNPRRPFFRAENLCDIVPFCDFYRGSFRNSFLKRITGLSFPLAIGQLNSGENYYLNLNGQSDDVGHTFIIGSTGSGKSVLLSFLSSQFMRYPESRVIYFDKDMSFGNNCSRSGGIIYNLLGDDESIKKLKFKDSIDNSLSFMPLGRIKDRPTEVEEWLEVAISSTNTPITPEITKRLTEVIDNWVVEFKSRDEGLIDDELVTDTERRLKPTLSNFLLRLIGHSGDSAPEVLALKKILKDEDCRKLFDGDKDTLSAKDFNRKTMFEMGSLMRRGTGNDNNNYVIYPALFYIFSRLDELFDNNTKPTLLILDEAWIFLQHKQFRAKIKEWLKTLRKKNVFVVMATQNIGDIDNLEEITTSCHTLIFAPNSMLRHISDDDEEKENSIKALYKKLNCTDEEIGFIGDGERKKQYIVKQEEGTSTVDFLLTQYQLERLSRDGF